jgi:hypothetical protein
MFLDLLPLLGVPVAAVLLMLLREEKLRRLAGIAKPAVGERSRVLLLLLPLGALSSPW